METYVADFETTVEEDKTRVWAYGFCEIGNVENFGYGTRIEEFMEWCRKSNKLIYFHNLKFDGEFIFYWLLTNGFKYSTKKEKNTFNCIVSNMGAFYQIEVIFDKFQKKYKKVVFQDSYKKLPFKVSKIAKDFKLPIEKLEVPDGFYEWEREAGHQLTELELKYLKHDVQVVAMALGIQFEQELDRMTIGSDALHNFKKVLGGGDIKKGRMNFKQDFPVLPLMIDSQIRNAYRGGFTYLSERFAGIDIGTGIVFDVNSLYPWTMRTKPLPYGLPFAFTGKYENDEFYPLYLQKLTCEFELKEGHIPTVQIKEGGRFKSTEYLKSSRDKMGDREVTLVMTNVDLDLFFEHYDVTVLSWEGGWKFKAAEGMFDEYIDYWMQVKEENAAEKNALYTLAKLMLNSLYGKFAKNPDVTGKHPYLNEDGAISYRLNDQELDKPVYTCMGAFITSYAREKTIRTAQSVYDRFIYADTDSIHLVGDELPDIEIHDSKLGGWKCEGIFRRGRFLRAKTYIEDMEETDKKTGKTDYVLHIVCAGMPDNVKESVTWENFRPGLSLHGKLTPHHVPGGIVLKPEYFTIKGEKEISELSSEQIMAMWDKEYDYDEIKEAVQLHGHIQIPSQFDPYYPEYKDLSRSVKAKYFRKKGLPLDVFADALDISVNDLIEKLN